MTGFQIKEEGEHHFTLHHPAGAHVTIAKKAISNEMLQKLRGLPKYAEGGEVDAPQSDVPPDDYDREIASQPVIQKDPNTVRAEQEQLASQKQKDADVDAGLAAKAETEKADLADTNAKIEKMAMQSTGANNAFVTAKNRESKAPTAPPSNIPLGGAAPASEQQSLNPLQKSDDQMQLMQAGLNESKKGIFGEAAAQGAIGQAQSDVLNQGISGQQNILSSYQEELQKLDAERSENRKAYAEWQGDPNRVWHNMNTGQKMGSIVGMLLGGIGGGGSGQPNAAMAVMDKLTEDDIKMQMADLGKKHNLLANNMEQYGNLRDATAATRLQYLDIQKSMLEKAALSQASPLAQARAHQLYGELETKAAPLMAELGWRRTMYKAGASNPAMMIQAMVPQGQQEAAYKELGTVQGIKKMGDDAVDSFDKVDQMSAAGAFSPRRRNAEVEPIIGRMVHESEGRITQQDTDMIRALFPMAIESNRTRQEKRKKLVEFLNTKMNSPMLDGYMIPAPRINANPKLKASATYKNKR